MKLSKEEAEQGGGDGGEGDVESGGRRSGIWPASLEVTEGALRYRLKKLEAGPARDGRPDQPTALDGYADVVEAM